MTDPRRRHGLRIESEWDMQNSDRAVSAAAHEADRTFQPMKALAEGSPADRLRWLLNFIQLPVKVLQEHWIDIAYEAGAFVYLNPDAVAKAPLADVLAAVVTVKTAMMDAVEGRKSPRIDIPPTSVTLLPKWSTKRRKPHFDGLEVVPSTQDFVAAILVTAMQTIDDAGDHLRVCARESCQTLFVKRKRMVFCSQKCSQSEQQRRYRARTPRDELSAERHRYYERTKQAEPGGNPAAQVHRNPRRRKSVEAK
jgi:hypothetical protein